MERFLAQIGWLGYVSLILGILAVGVATWLAMRANQKNKNKTAGQGGDKKCLNLKKLMEDKLRELTDLKAMAGDFARSTSVAEIRKKTKSKDVNKILDLAEKAERDYEKLKKLYEECITLPSRTINKVAWIVIKNRKVLFVRSSKNKDIFYTPGGKVNSSESENQALLREIKEELSIDLKPATIQYLETFRDQAHGESPGTMVEIKCYTSEFTGTIKPSGEIAEIAAFSSKDSAKSAGVGKKVLEWLKAENLID